MAREDGGVPTPVVALVGAVISAVVGWLLLFQHRPLLSTLAVPAGAVVVGALVATLLVRTAPAVRGPEPRHRPITDRPADDKPVDDWWTRQPSPPVVPRRPAPVRPPVEAPPDGATAVLPRPALPQPAQLVLPLDGGAGPWWGRDAADPAPASPAPPARPTPRALDEYRAAARVVQCPRCGAFRIDVTQAETRDGPAFVFRCRADEHEWIWRPGTAWPVTVVASHRRTSH
jgi:hypothetical protein